MRAEDALPDHLNATSVNGVAIRKGTIAAFIANARVCADGAAPIEARDAAERDIVDSLPALRAIGLFEVMAVRDQRVRAIVEGASTMPAGSRRMKAAVIRDRPD